MSLAGLRFGAKSRWNLSAPAETKSGSYIFAGDPSEYHDWEFRTKLRTKRLRSPRNWPRSPRQYPVVADLPFRGKGSGMVKAKGVAHSPRKKRQKMKRELQTREQLFLWKKTKKT